jgi:C1A family cysteine protease
MKYGWIPDTAEQRQSKNYGTILTLLPESALPNRVDLRERTADGFDPPWDQGHEGACVVHGCGEAVRYMDPVNFHEDIPSRHFMYYWGRKAIGTIHQDSGCRIWDVIQSINERGVCHESMWPYDAFNFTLEPSMASQVEAEQHQALVYERLDDQAGDILTTMLQCLANAKPFPFGSILYESFESIQVSKTGNVPMPKSNEKQVGGHCMLAVGYDRDVKIFIVRNSWGIYWGQGGYCAMPFDYLSDQDLTHDRCCIDKME